MLLINGDSWTGGPTYKNQNDHWPYQLAEKYNIPITNLAYGGSSVDRAFRTTIEYLYSNNQMPTHLIIGWPGLERFEFPSGVGYYMRITHTKCDTFVETESKVPNIEAIRKIFYTQMYHKSLFLKKFRNNLLILQDLCRLKNIKFINFNSAWEKPELMTDPAVDKLSWILPPTETMATHLDALGFGRLTTTPHTTEEGQAAWADIMFDHIKSSYS